MDKVYSILYILGAMLIGLGAFMIHLGKASLSSSFTVIPRSLQTHFILCPIDIYPSRRKTTKTVFYY